MRGRHATGTGLISKDHYAKEFPGQEAELTSLYGHVTAEAVSLSQEPCGNTIATMAALEMLAYAYTHQHVLSL